MTLTMNHTIDGRVATLHGESIKAHLCKRISENQARAPERPLGARFWRLSRHSAFSGPAKLLEWQEGCMVYAMVSNKKDKEGKGCVFQMTFFLNQPKGLTEP